MFKSKWKVSSETIPTWHQNYTEIATNSCTKANPGVHPEKTRPRSSRKDPQTKTPKHPKITNNCLGEFFYTEDGKGPEAVIFHFSNSLENSRLENRAETLYRCRGGSRYVEDFMLLCFYGFIILKLDGFMVVCLYGFMVLWIYSFIVLWFYSLYFMVLWFYGFIVFLIYGLQVVWFLGFPNLPNFHFMFSGIY